MNYTKPELVVLGAAADAIDFTLAKGWLFRVDLFHFGMNPAYDLDE